MDYDLLVRGGRLVDGSGQPSYIADVGVKDGIIVDIGRLKGSAEKTIDADGLVVSPGFIDHHTHLDGQIFWDPYGTCEPENGITSVVMGNCGLTLHPVPEGGKEALLKSLIRIEAIPRKVLEDGVPWGWETTREYLDALEGRVGINVGSLIGHVAIRHYVMGEEAVARAATGQEVELMQGLVRDGMMGGAMGISTNRQPRHMREDGKPVASRLADDAEFDAICDVLGDMNSGIIETIAGLHQPEHSVWYDHLARRSGRPIIWQTVLSRPNEPNLWKEQLEAIEPTFRDGYRAYAITMTEQAGGRFTMKAAQNFDEFPIWKALMFSPEEVRKEAFKDPETRDKLRADLATERRTAFHKRWDLVWIDGTVKTENARFVGKSVAEMAAMVGKDPLDAFLDLSLEEELGTTFRSANTGSDRVVMGQILQHPHVIMGISDAGAHVRSSAHFGYGTTLLGVWVRERGVMSLEHAVSRLTHEIASIYGINDRGLVRNGYAADLAIFDPETVGAREAEPANDLPGGAPRMVQRADGMHYTIVNGTVVCKDGKMTGALPGKVLRGSAYVPAG